MSKLIETKAEFQALAGERLAEAKLLLDAGKWDGAFYLAGYAVELALKACIIKTLMSTDAFPERKFSENCYTHSIEKLVALAKLDGLRKLAIDADPSLLANWNLARDWSEEKRYHRISKAEAESLYLAIEDGAHGSLSMDPDTVVSEQIDSGKKLIDALLQDGIDVRLAFWAKPTEDEKWYLYLVTPLVDNQGPAVAYRLVHATLRKMPGLWIDPLEIKVVGPTDSLAVAAITANNRRSQKGPYTAMYLSSHTGVTKFGEAVFGGMNVDGALIYPPTQPITST